MHEGNLSIVFGPNLLRSKDKGSELTDTPKILAAVQTMINYYNFLFEEGRERRYCVSASTFSSHSLLIFLMIGDQQGDSQESVAEREAIEKRRHSWRPVQMPDGRTYFYNTTTRG
jgi:hypothetical protein